MIIDLVELPETTRGIYTVHGIGGRLGDSQRWLVPSAAAAFAGLQAAVGGGGIILSDVFRSASEQLVAYTSKPGTQPAGFSAHGYGLAVDVAVEATMSAFKWTYPELLSVMAAHGWYCHRRDGQEGSEGWHYNWLGVGEAAQRYLALAEAGAPGTWADPVEALIQDLWGPEMVLDDMGLQVTLRSLRLYHGAVDGVVGPLTLGAVHAFQRAWKLPEGYADARTQRTLAYVAAVFSRTSADGLAVIV